MEMVAFGYRCQECGQGIVQAQTIPEFHTKIKGYPFVVKDARIGICDACGAKHFGAKEIERWERMFDEEHAGEYLKPEDIRGLRTSLDLTMEQFAALIGSTRQSLHNWERKDRTKPQSRMADLLMKLVRESRDKSQVDVLQFLFAEAKRLGTSIQLDSESERTMNSARQGWQATTLRPIVLSVKKVPSISQTRQPEVVQLAADTLEQETHVTVHRPDTLETLGRLCYDFETAALKLVLSQSLDLEYFDAEIRFADGTSARSNRVRAIDREVTLLSGTDQTEEDVSEVVLLPC